MIKAHWLSSELQKRVMYLFLFGMLLSSTQAQVGPPPVIVLQPVGVSIVKHQPANFTVVAVSGTAMTYKWYRDSSVLSGATSNVLSIAKVQKGDAGAYKVQISNASGMVTSANAALVVLDQPIQQLRISRALMTPAGFRLDLTGLTVSTCVISASTNLTDWTPISTNNVSSGDVTWWDTSATNRTFRFYKAEGN